MMSKTFPLVVSAVLCLGLLPASGQFGPPGAGPREALLGGATGKLFGDNQTFSARMEMQTSDSDGKTITMPGQLSFDTGKTRFEINVTDMQGVPMAANDAAQMKSMGMDQMVTIARPDKNAAYIVYPGMQSFVETELPEAASPAATNSDYKVETVEMGKDTVDGHACVKNQVTVTDKDGNKHVSTVWNATDLKKFPVKIQSTESGSPVIMLFKNVSLAKPNASLFDVPSAYTKYDDVRTMIQQQVMKRMGGPGIPRPPGMPGP